MGKLCQKNYKVSFYNYETELHKEEINFSEILDFWSGKSDSAGTITIYLENIIIKSYLFDEFEIENDIAPYEFNSIEDHEQLMSYMKELSKALNKTIILTPENSKEIILLSVDNDDIIFRS